MLLGARQFFESHGNAEEEMYKELLIGLLNKTLTEVDIADEIDARGSDHAAGARPFYGQSNLKKLRLRNFYTNRTSTQYLDGMGNLEELWLDNTPMLTNSLLNMNNGHVTYVYMPSVTYIQNPVNIMNNPAVFDFGDSRTCQQLLDSWSSLFEGSPSHNWTFRCSDGDVAWDGSAWSKITS